MALILDTNALSAFVDGDSRLSTVIEGEPVLAIPTVVLGEYLFGIRASRHRPSYERWLQKRLPAFRVLPVGLETSGFYAQIRAELKAKGRPIPTNDVWIAALAQEFRYSLVSRDRHFDAVETLSRISW